MKNQRIGCRVDSCKFNQEDCTCGLSSIEVCACPGCGSGNPADETQCGSYKSRRD